MTVNAQPSERRTEFQTAAAKNVANARTAIPGTDTRTRAMNSLLSDIATFDPQVKDGALYTAAGRLELGLSLGGLSTIGFDGEDTSRVREALRAYGEFLILVADNAL